MNPEIEINERIESFLNGDLPAEEMNAFRQKILEDLILAHLVDQHIKARGIITDGSYIKFKNDLRNVHLKSVKTKKINRIRGMILGGLMTVAITLIFLNTIRKTEKTQPISDIETDSVQKEITAVEKFNDTVPLLKNSKTDNFHRHPDVELKPVYPEASVRIETSDKSISQITRGEIPDKASGQHPVTGPMIYKTDTSSVDSSSDCSAVIIKGRYMTTESCTNRPTGSISVETSTLSGGRAPYEFSLSLADFRDSLNFSGLIAGSYTLYARDADHCISRLGIAYVGSVDCSYQAVFTPTSGEIWLVPTDPEKAGALIIFSKSGALVYSIRFSDHETVVWEGTTLTGQMLPMGIYRFDIRYIDGNNFTGNVTILR